MPRAALTALARTQEVLLAPGAFAGDAGHVAWRAALAAEARALFGADHALVLLAGVPRPYVGDGFDAGALDSEYTEAVAPALPGLALPAAIVWGAQDHQMQPEYAARLAGDRRGAEVTWVEDASPFVPGDWADLVADAGLRLVARPAGPPPAA